MSEMPRPENPHSTDVHLDAGVYEGLYHREFEAGIDAQRELLEGWRKVPSVLPIDEIMAKAEVPPSHIPSFHLGIDALHRWLLEER